MGFYVYKYVYQDKVVYIGQTINLDNRIKAHSQEIRFYGLQEVYYFECNNKLELDVNESFGIDYYKPVLNQTNNQIYLNHLELVYKKPEWKRYDKIYNNPMPLIDFHNNEQIIQNFLNQRLYHKSGVLYDGTLLHREIPIYDLLGLGTVIKEEDFINYTTEVENKFFEIIGKESEIIINHFLSEYKNLKSVSYIGKNTFRPVFNE